jgi:glycosyltransferase involved in cell wall biosynthesis
LKILYVTSYLFPEEHGGVGIYTYNLAKYLAKTNDVHVISMSKDMSLKDYEVKETIDNGIKKSSIKVPAKAKVFEYLLNKETLSDKKIDKAFGLLLDKIKPDVVHVMHLKGLSASMVLEAKTRKIPLVFTAHDYWAICSRITLLGPDGSVCARKDNVCGNCSGFKRKAVFKDKLKSTVKNKAVFSLIYLAYLLISPLLVLTEWINQYSLARNEYLKDVILPCFEKVITPSKYVRNKLINAGFDGKNISVSNCGVDMAAFKGFKKNASGKVRIGYCGGFAKHKGIDVLINAFCGFKNDPNVVLKIYGGSELDRKSEYEGILKECKNIEVVGGYSDVAAPYKDMDVLIVPSVWEETQGLVIQEAFITMTPVIASSIGAFPEFVRDGISGFLFEPGNVQDLSLKIKTIVDNKEIIKKLSQNLPGRPTRTIEEQGAEFLELYNSLKNA